MKKLHGVILFTVIVVIVVAVVVFSSGNNPPTNPGSQSNNSLQPVNSTLVVTQQDTGISAQDLAIHNTRQNCWVGFEGKVYDITSWLPRHPGSAGAIEPYCGKSREFESAFEGQHGRSQVEKLLEEGVYKGDLA